MTRPHLHAATGDRLPVPEASRRRSVDLLRTVAATFPGRPALAAAHPGRPALAAAHPGRPADAAAHRRPPASTAVRTLTWSELDDLADRNAARLGEAGLGPGDVAAFAFESALHSVLLVLACLRAGVTAAPLGPRLPARGILDACRALGSPALFTADAGPFDPALLEGTPGPARRARRRTTRFATAVFTSGSTGEPRAAVHRLAAHLAGAVGTAAALGFGAGSRWLLSLPTHHAGGLAILFRALATGGSVAIPEPGEGPVDAAERLGATHASFVATQLLRRSAPPPASLERVLLGGGPLPYEALAEAAGLGWPLSASYGMTETASAVTATRPDDPIAALRTAGTPLPGRCVRIGEGGAIEVAGPMLHEGFLVDGRFEPAGLRDGWFATGDLGEMDPAGRLVVTGRSDLRFVSGGENVQPEAIERVLLDLPTVRSAVVVPVPDAEFGARPFAWIDPPADAAALERAIRERLPGFMVPVAFRPMPAPDPGSLKPRRAHLADLAARERQGGG